MQTPDLEALVPLSDTDQVLENPDEDVRGLKVKAKDGEDLGEVKSLLIDQKENRVRFLEVASGGFLGIGQERVYIPVDAITSIDDENREIRIDQSRQHVADAPVYDPELIVQPESYTALSGHYGYAPFASPGYVYPPFPYFR